MQITSERINNKIQLEVAITQILVDFTLNCTPSLEVENALAGDVEQEAIAGHFGERSTTTFASALTTCCSATSIKRAVSAAMVSASLVAPTAVAEAFNTNTNAPHTQVINCLPGAVIPGIGNCREEETVVTTELVPISNAHIDFANASNEGNYIIAGELNFPVGTMLRFEFTAPHHTTNRYNEDDSFENYHSAFSIFLQGVRDNKGEVYLDILVDDTPAVVSANWYNNEISLNFSDITSLSINNENGGVERIEIQSIRTSEHPSDEASALPAFLQLSQINVNGGISEITQETHGFVSMSLPYSDLGNDVNGVPFAGHHYGIVYEAKLPEGEKNTECFYNFTNNKGVKQDWRYKTYPFEGSFRLNTLPLGGVGPNDQYFQIGFTCGDTTGTQTFAFEGSSEKHGDTVATSIAKGYVDNNNPLVAGVNATTVVRDNGDSTDTYIRMSLEDESKGDLVVGGIVFPIEGNEHLVDTDTTIDFLNGHKFGIIARKSRDGEHISLAVYDIFKDIPLNIGKNGAVVKVVNTSLAGSPEFLVVKEKAE